MTMMYKGYVVLVVALLGLMVAAAPDKSLTETHCQMGDWLPWGDCVPEKQCKNDKGSLLTLPVEATQTADIGRAHMGRAKYEKFLQWRATDKCRQEGTCPELMPKASKKATVCQDGMADEYPCHNIDMLSFINFEDLSGGRANAQTDGNDIWGWTDPVNGDEYVIMGLTIGSSFVRVTDPQNPVVVGYLHTRTYESDWRDMKVHNDHVFIVSEASNHGMQVVDLTQFRGSNEFKEITATAEYLEFGNAHNIVVNEETGYVFVVGATRGDTHSCSGGLHMIDVNDPANPKFAGCFKEDGYVHDAQCVIYQGPDVAYFDKEICFCFNEDTLTIADVTDKSSVDIVSKISYNGYRYTHQGWVTEDHTVLLLDDELDEMLGSDSRTHTYVWDVTSLQNPELKNTYYSSETAIDHNLYIKGNLVYQTNYQAGLRILDINQGAYDLTELAYFDVYPSATNPSFAGSWSNYPYYKNGMVAVSSIDFGLYMLMPNYEAMAAELKIKEAQGLQERRRQTTTPNCPTLLESRTCSTVKC